MHRYAASERPAAAGPFPIEAQPRTQQSSTGTGMWRRLFTHKASTPRRQPAFATGIMVVLALLAIGTVADGTPRTQRGCPRAELSTESSGPRVARLQRALAARGFDPGAVDGLFGLATRSAVIAFQHEQGVVADGAVDRATWRKLFKNRC